MNTAEFDKVARGPFARVYPVIAARIRERTGIVEGACLDLGAGGGYLGIALARITDLDVGLLDCSSDMISIAERNIAESGLSGRLTVIRADAHALPIKTEAVNLVISRGSFFFWHDQKKALAEAWRVLAAGGRAYIGGGLGTRELAQEIRRTMKQSGREMSGRAPRCSARRNTALYEDLLTRLGASPISIAAGDEGFWLHFGKARASRCSSPRQGDEA